MFRDSAKRTFFSNSLIPYQNMRSSIPPFDTISMSRVINPQNSQIILDRTKNIINAILSKFGSSETREQKTRKHNKCQATLRCPYSDHRELSRVANNHLLLWPVSSVSLLRLNQLDNIHALQNLPKYDVPLVQPRCLHPPDFFKLISVLWLSSYFY